MPLPRSTLHREPVTEPDRAQADHASSLNVFVVSHTHWDREWYHGASRFRQRLVALVDALLLEAPSVGESFLLDGQAVVLEDYLSVRPEQANALSERLGAGVLEAGPWYVLADNLIPSGEAIVRNLLAGRRVLKRLGAMAPPVLYCPDSFGHPAALPLIAHGFGLPVAIVWRGLGGARTPAVDTMRWIAANGLAVLVYHLPPDGYETGSALPVARKASATRWANVGTILRTRSNVAVALLPNGADHHARQLHANDAIDALRIAVAPDRVVRSSLQAFAECLLVAADKHHERVPHIHGELRDSYGYTWTLGGTLATRSAQKRDNARAERLLLRDVEPWLVLAWLHGDTEFRSVRRDAQLTLAQAPALLDTAWRTLLRAHPHDTLCGCSIDAVARAMNFRMASARAQGVGLRDAALNIALHHDAVEARSRVVNATGVVVVRNRSARARGGVAEITVDNTLGDVAVGPGSGDAVAMASSRADTDVAIGSVLVQHVASRRVFRRRESPQHYPDNDLVQAHRVLAWVPPVPALGVRVLQLVPTTSATENTTAQQTHDVDRDRTHVTGAIASANTVEINNGLVMVRISRSGIAVTSGERAVHDALTFVTARDVGDAYTASIASAERALRLFSYKLTASGPLRASVRVEWRSTGSRRQVRVAATLSVDAGSAIVRVEIRGENRRKNHRLRACFATGVAQRSPHAQVWADAAFGAVLRTPLELSAEQQRAERVVPTMPLHRWVSLSNEDAGATIHADGLAEAEVLADGVVAVTLLRAIGQLSRNNLVQRPGHAGWPARIPLAQSQGKFQAQCALQLHAPWSAQVRRDVEWASDDFLLPLTGTTWRDLRTDTREQTGGPQLEGQGLRFSAVTLADDGVGIVLRCVNDEPETQTGAWVLPFDAQWEVALARLDETLLESWRTSTARIAIAVPPKDVLTLRVRRREH